uniref:Rab interacting lysosomal protein n=1 Tax=Amazona collaria TaxID=241587 RepID=A0A8B9FX24_9PSIT
MAEALWRTPPGRLAPPHVYRMAGALGAELRRLSARFGPDAVTGLVPPVVRLLELLEALVAPAAGLLSPVRVRLCPDNVARKEREVMLRLKEVVDKQRDELRAQAHEIVCKSRDTEALQEQLHRFMAMNEDLRHKVAVVQAQLKSALEKKSDLEAEEAPSPTGEPQPQDAGRSPAHCCFSKEELQQILQERNELKTNLFLVQEELAYYQRELLNEERIPSFFLDAMKSTVKRQRKKIRAKMLGTTEESESLTSAAGILLWLNPGSVAGAGLVAAPLVTSHTWAVHMPPIPAWIWQREVRWWQWDCCSRRCGWRLLNESH